MDRFPRQQKNHRHSARDFAEDGRLDSAELFARRDEVLIHHQGEVYRLRLTRNGKLILNK
ncbi:MAG: hemin uptake protein HemP [Phycisphaerae bacterium]